MSEVNYREAGRYRHYKGGEYEVLGIAINEATLEPVVVYKPLGTGPRAKFLQEYGATMWTRPLANFNEQVRIESGLGVTEDTFVPRFEKIS